MNLFAMPTYNGKYLSPNSAKPICGISTDNAYVRTLLQAKVMDEYLIPGTPVKLMLTEDTGNSSTTNAGLKLSPNVLFATSNSTGKIDSWSLSSPTDFMNFGDEYPVPVRNQIAYVAKAGSGAEFYLPCDDSIRTFDSTGTTVVKWGANGLTTSADDTRDIVGLTLISQVVFGIAPYYDNVSKTFKVKEVNAVKVKI